MARSRRFGSNTIDLTHPINGIVAFAWAIHLANKIKLLTHYAKGTTSRFNFLSAYRSASSGSVSPVIDLLLIVPSRYYSLSLYISYLALEDGSPLFRQLLSRPTHTKRSCFNSANMLVVSNGWPHRTITFYGMYYTCYPFQNIKSSYSSLRLSYVRSPLLIGSRLISFPRLTTMFRFSP